MFKILFADDEPDITMIVERKLELMGYEVIVKTNGRQALAALQEVKPDLVILDVMMPEMNGWDVCKKIKENEATKSIPVIILTAKTQDMDELMSYESGADRYVSKPIDFSLLINAMEELLPKK